MIYRNLIKCLLLFGWPSKLHADYRRHDEEMQICSAGALPKNLHLDQDKILMLCQEEIFHALVLIEELR